MWAKNLNDLKYSKATQELVACWQDLPRYDGLVCPKRSDFSSIRIGAFLAEVFISEWIGDENLSIIQAGTKLDRVLGKDITGQNIFDVLPLELLAEELKYYHTLRDTPCAGMITRSALNLKGKPVIYRTMQLPLADSHGNVRYFVGTGVALSENILQQEFNITSCDHVELLERLYFDIGAGVPAEG
ncbi:PAS domain-containing protein [Kordiimonas pumila]|uniref:PAS domain-containing protein n=1 Tax=Kordiimonas pumila TaxID=2161677 RepID=A0ABV7D2S8_9PROT|nr:PAS domain-containing protein [Kordiimonas pumila]